MKLRDQMAEENEKEEQVNIIEQKIESGKSKEQAEHKEQNEKRNNEEEEGGRGIIRRLEKIRDGINTEMNQHIKELEEMIAETEEKKQKENLDMQPGKDTAGETKIPWASNPFAVNLNPATDTKKREREEDTTDEKISFGLSTI